MSEYSAPLVGVISSVLTLITAYFTKFKKDDAKLQVLEVKLEDCQDKIKYLTTLIENNEKHTTKIPNGIPHSDDDRIR